MAMRKKKYYSLSGLNNIESAYTPAFIDPQAQAFYDRVIADAGPNAVVPTGLVGLSATFKAIKAIYGVSDITQALSVFYDAHYLAYKKGTGIGATAGQAIEKLYSACGASGDCVQTTLSSQPLLLAHSGASSDNYWFGSGVSGNLNTSNLQSAFNFGGDFSMVFDIKPLASTSMELSGCLNGLFYTFGLFSSGVLSFSGNGSTINSTTSLNTTIRQWVRVSRNGSNWLFYTSSDGITWTQLGTTVINAVSLSAASINIRVGDGAGSIGNPCNGKLYRALFYTDSTLTTIRADFNPATYNAATSQTQWTSTTGEVWTINTGTATTGYKGVLVDRTIVQADGVDDKMVQSTANRGDTCTQYAAIKYAAVATPGAAFIDAQSHASYNSIAGLNSTTIRIYFENTKVIDRTVVAQTLNLITITNTNAAQTASINNGTNGTNTQNPSTSKTGVTIFANGAGGALQQGFLNTYLCSNSINNSTVRTAMYNYIRSINNNAF
jgi:hypothetical protein